MESHASTKNDIYIIIINHSNTKHNEIIYISIYFMGYTAS